MTTQIGDGGGGFAGGVAVQTNDRIVVAGDAPIGGVARFTVVRYMPNGKLDRSFGGSGGMVIVPFGDYSSAYAVAIQRDGKIVVAGEGISGTHDDFAFARLLPNGSLDHSFSGDGMATVPVSPSDGPDYARAVALGPGGVIVGAGFTTDGAGVVRLTPSGDPDPTFSGDGVVDIPANASNGAEDVTVQRNGKVVVAIPTGSGAGDGFTLVRLNVDGGPDTQFGPGGVLHTPVGDEGRSQSVAVQSNGRIVAGGYAEQSGSPLRFALARFTAAGALDHSFDGTGIQITPVGPPAQQSAGQKVVLQPNGRIFLAGNYDSDPDPSKSENALAYARFNANGALDPSFAGAGRVAAPLPPGITRATIEDAALAGDGKLVVAGEASFQQGMTTLDKFYVARILGDPIDRFAPHSAIDPIPHKVRAAHLKRFSGKASDDVAVKTVDIALLRGASKHHPGCRWLKNDRAKFKRRKAHHGRCTDPLWRRAAGATAWSYDLRKHLPAGSYVLYSRATDTSGRRETTFSIRAGNRAAFKVR